MPVPQNWSDDGTALTAPNGQRVALGFRSHILNAASWDAGNQPNETEYHSNQVLLHNASVGPGQRQTFRDSLLWWTQQKGVVEEPYLGLELKSCYDLISAQQAEIAQLRNEQAPKISDAVTKLQALRSGSDTTIAAVLADLNA